MSKKILSLFTIFSLMLLTLVACGSKSKITIQVETEMKVGETYQVKYELENIDESVELSWKVSDTGIAELNSEKLTVKALKEGTFTLTVTAKTGEVASKEIKVVKGETSLTKYTITLELNGGQLNSDRIMEYNEKGELLLPIPTKFKCEFDGWYMQSNFSGKVVEKIEPGTTGDITLYAKWADKPKYTITLELNGGELNTNSLEYYVEFGYSLPTPVKDGYVFKGWYKNKDLTGIEIKEIEPGTTGDIILYAKWEEGQYIPPEHNVVWGINCETNQEFAERIKKFNTQNKIYVSFDFDVSDDVLEKRYTLDTLVKSNKIDADGNAYDVDVIEYWGYTVEYEFSYYGDDEYFLVKCLYYENYDNINAETLNFELQYIDGNTYMYKLKSSDKVIMEIKIQVDNYPISKVIELLQKNIVFIK